MPDACAAEPREFAARLAADLAGLLGDDLMGVYLHGSAVLGGWTANRSDVDVLFVLADGLGPDQVAAAGEVLLAAAGSAPGRGLECSAVAAGAAAVPAPPWPFLLHVGLRDGRPAVDPGQDHAGDPDLLMHYAVARAAGAAVTGPPPEALIGEVSRPLILEYLAAELNWGLAHGPESYAVLNACRALVYLRSGQIVSKVAGGRTALRQAWGTGELIRSALNQQTGRDPERPPSRAAVAFVSEVATKLNTAV